MKCDACGETATHNKRMFDRCAKIIEKFIREVGPDVWNKIPDCKYNLSNGQTDCRWKSSDTRYRERYPERWIGIGI
jgi:hypothetical protein